MAAMRRLAQFDFGEMPERLIGTRWKRDGRSDVAREFKSRSLLHLQRCLFSSVGEQAVDNRQVVRSIRTTGTNKMTR